MTADVDRKRLAGPVLGFVGGLMILVYAVAELSEASGAGMAGSLGGIPLHTLSGVTDAGVAGVVLGVLLVTSSIALGIYPDEGQSLGFLMIAFSVGSVVSVGGGNGVGLLLGVLGGTCGLVFGPETEQERARRMALGPGAPERDGRTPPDRRSPEAHRWACPSCRKLVPAQAPVCPYCGQPMR